MVLRLCILRNHLRNTPMDVSKNHNNLQKPRDNLTRTFCDHRKGFRTYNRKIN